ncbi:CpsB/CapC family capsule biosynthesis tyrosine phosphatase [Conexibacter woesei]|uniref:protein-tyrosine-phosphatase n=1 Tax=Conexibacter woesei (strain DSM 14684 / CCUG 47730 / CIP 108061 / JCM 11494 / NBRC 100937 / ID131577) TaxID=469383 RepID=D3FCD8_CONWI|nr:CpsB/CapC family capsule biosynthesis tyrosine phosphatase [Conexibacter woesei]ADB49411.1 capsular polysaccharide biosynthesis protein [Conexibacter woesei DSM 14684]
MDSGFVDLHVHLLPGVDDGPPDLDATLELAGLEVADGVVAATATPHVASVDVAELPWRVAEVNAALAKAHIPLVVEAGGELGVRGVPRLSAEELELIAHGPADARWILLEAPLDGAMRTLHGAADQLRAAGYGIVLAHPERCLPLFDDDMRGLMRELERGSLAQVSSSSLLGLHGIRARRNAARILAGGHAGLLASDAHGPRRPPCLTAALRAACELGLGVEQARALCADRPRALLQEGLRPLAPASGSSYVAGSDVSVVRRPPFGVAAAPS